MDNTAQVEAQAETRGDGLRSSVPATTDTDAIPNDSTASNVHSDSSIILRQETRAAENMDDRPSYLATSSTVHFGTSMDYGESSRAAASRSHTGLMPQIYRAVKDVGDPSESLQRARVPLERSITSTITTLFKATSPDSQPSPQTSFLLSPTSRPSLQSMNLGTHIYKNGLLEGRHSDISVNAFGTTYRLHRLILEQSPYFASAFSGRWLESSYKELDLHPEDTDPNITKEAFEIALKRLYGQRELREEIFHCHQLLSVGSWLEMPDLVNDSVENIIRTLQATNLSPTINLVTSSYYGKAGERVLQAANILLRREGAEISVRCWDHIPSSIIRNAVAADDFFIRSEWERWILAKKLLNRKLKNTASFLGLRQETTASQAALLVLRRAGRSQISQITSETLHCVGSTEQKALRAWAELYTHPDITPFQDLFDNGIHYIHLDFESLQSVKAAKDIFGVPIVAHSLVADALWGGIELRQKVLSADAYAMQLGLAKRCGETDSNADAEKQSALPGSLAKIALANVVNLDQETNEKNTIHDVDESKTRYMIPPCDRNISIGAGPGPLEQSKERKKTRNSQFQSNRSISPTAMQETNKTPDAVDSDSQQQLYSDIPPFRFSVEFPNPRLLDERKHVHSQSVFYAGSFWNVYIQKLRNRSKDSKVPQLGVYLRRAEDGGLGDTGTRRAKRASRSVDERIGDLERDMLLRIGMSQSVWSPRGFDDSHHREVESLAESTSTTIHDSFAGAPASLGRTDSGSRTGAGASTQDTLSVPQISVDLNSSEEEEQSGEEQSQTTAIPPYVDDRPFLKAYFRIFCPSPGGRSLNVWESIPDTFSLRQSWGWRSSALMSEAPQLNTKADDDPLPSSSAEVETPTGGFNDGSRLEASSIAEAPHAASGLKFSVVIGLV